MNDEHDNETDETTAPASFRFYELDGTLIRTAHDARGYAFSAAVYEPSTDTFERALGYMSVVETNPHVDELSETEFERLRVEQRARHR